VFLTKLLSIEIRSDIIACWLGYNCQISL